MSLLLPNPPRAGEPIRAEHFARLIDYCRAITPQSSPSCRVSTTASGTTFQHVARPGAEDAGGDGVDYSMFAFGFSISGNVVKVSPGNVRHGTRNVVAVAGRNITINADHTWIYVSYTYGGGAVLENSTTAPTSVENILRVPLHKWRLESGVVRLEQILHVGDIIIPGAFA